MGLLYFFIFVFYLLIEFCLHKRKKRKESKNKIQYKDVSANWGVFFFLIIYENNNNNDELKYIKDSIRWLLCWADDGYILVLVY